MSSHSVPSTQHSALPLVAIIGRPNVGESRTKYSKTSRHGNPLRLLAGFALLCLLASFAACIRIHVANASVEAAAKGDEAELQRLLDQGRDVNSRDSHGTTPLIAAAVRSQTHIVKLLLTRGADLNAQDSQGATALMAACNNGDIEMVEILLNAGINVNLTNKIGAGALSFASSQGHTRIVRALVAAGANVNQSTEAGVTSLIMAARYGHLETTKALLGAHADVNARVTNIVGYTSFKVGDTASAVAKRHGHKDIVQMLQVAGASE